jgi:phage gp29-like protein
MKMLCRDKSNRWRDGLNPLQGISLPRMVGLLQAGERGQYSDLQWFYYYMERSDAMVQAVLQRRRSAFMGCDWDVRLVSGRRRGVEVDRVLAGEQAAVLREAYERIENFRDALGFLFTGFFRGFGHLEKHVDSDGTVTRLEPVEQWFWLRDGLFGAWEYNQDALSGRWRGVPIDREGFILFESVALDRILSVLYLRKTLSQRDWDSFLETYGIPSVFLIGPPNTPAAKEAEYQAIAESIISDGRGYLPNGSDIKYVNAYGARAPFLEQIEHIDKQITIAATGGLLTVLAESGSGTLAGNAHSDTFLQIARSDAAILSGVMQEQFDMPLLRRSFPGRPIHAYFEFAPAPTDEVSRVVRDAVELAKAGVRIDMKELSEKTGYRLELAASPTPAEGSQVAGGVDKI